MFQNRKSIPLIVFLLLFSNQCWCDPADELLATAVNTKYKLTVSFAGERVIGTKLNGETSEFIYVKRVFIKNNKTGEKIEYKAKDFETLGIHQGYFTDVWSPDLEFLLLPVSRFSGFAVYKADHLFLSLRKQQKYQRINIRLEDFPAALVHKFNKWESNNTVVFDVGFSNDYFTLKYNIRNRLLITKDKNYKIINE